MKILESITPVRPRNIHLPDFSIRTNLRETAMKIVLHEWRQQKHPQNQESLINFINLYANCGYRAAIPLSELPRDHYRRRKAINNTQLGIFADELAGKQPCYPARAFTFGSAFHCAILEPEDYSPDNYCLKTAESLLLDKMLATLLATKHYQDIRGSQCEKPVYWIDEATGLPCKALIDSYQPSLVRDLKTTNAKTREEFLAACMTYDYDRQMAFYAGATKASHVEIIGVQKRPPYKIFVVTRNQDSKFLKSGNRKVNQLLMTWKKAERTISR